MLRVHRTVFNCHVGAIRPTETNRSIQISHRQKSIQVNDCYCASFYCFICWWSSTNNRRLFATLIEDVLRFRHFNFFFIFVLPQKTNIDKFMVNLSLICNQNWRWKNSLTLTCPEHTNSMHFVLNAAFKVRFRSVQHADSCCVSQFYLSPLFRLKFVYIELFFMAFN